MNTPSAIWARTRHACTVLGLSFSLGLLGLTAASLALAQGSVTPPNGTYSHEVVDLSVQSAAGPLEWKRTFNGAGWRFNRHWDGISAGYKPVMT